jgi:hypothetical protein
MKDAFGEKEPDRKFLIQSRGAHGDRNRFAYQSLSSAKPENNFERFLDGEVVNVGGGLILRHIPANAKITDAGGFHG